MRPKYHWPPHFWRHSFAFLRTSRPIQMKSMIGLHTYKKTVNAMSVDTGAPCRPTLPTLITWPPLRRRISGASGTITPQGRASGLFQIGRDTYVVSGSAGRSEAGFSSVVSGRWSETGSDVIGQRTTRPRRGATSDFTEPHKDGGTAVGGGSVWHSWGESESVCWDWRKVRISPSQERPC